MPQRNDMKETGNNGSTSSDTTREVLPFSELLKPSNVTPPQNRVPNVPNPGDTTVPPKQ
jgi:hypothetical protein